MISFFANVRPFRGEFAEIQRTAIASWLSVAPGAHATIIGDVEGAAGAAESFKIDHCADVATNELGTELVPDIWRLGTESAKHEWICAINSDNVVGADILDAIEALEGVECPLVVGQRWDVVRGKPNSGVLHPPGGVDWFLFRRGTVPVAEIPPFAVGRTCYDNWLIWAGLNRWEMTVIDATDMITVIHLSHGYPEYGSHKKMMMSEEKKENTRLMHENGAPRCFRIDDAPFVLSGGELRERA